IRDFHVTGVQTCALPISPSNFSRSRKSSGPQGASFNGGLVLAPEASRLLMLGLYRTRSTNRTSSPSTGSRRGGRIGSPPPSRWEIGRASCRERVDVAAVG